jgi:hypothetical protein
MKTDGKARRIGAALLLAFLLLTHGSSLPSFAQGSADATQGPALDQTKDASAKLHAILELDGGWRFQVGDDPRWADTGFDDSKWPTIS